MVATVQILEKNGAGPSTTDKTGGTVRFKNADDANVDTQNPLVIPTSNTEYSMEKVLRMNIGGTGPDTEITNLEFYMDGAKGWAAGIKLWHRALAAYTVPGTPNEANATAEMPVGGTPAASTDAFGSTSGSPLSLGAGPYSGTNTEIGDHVYLSLEVEIGSTQGTLANEQATFRYDEI